MFTHVRCRNCQSRYNGRTGGWNTGNIWFYVLVLIPVEVTAILGFIFVLIAIIAFLLR